MHHALPGGDFVDAGTGGGEVELAAHQVVEDDGEDAVHVGVGELERGELCQEGGAVEVGEVVVLDVEVCLDVGMGVVLAHGPRAVEQYALQPGVGVGELSQACDAVVQGGTGRVNGHGVVVSPEVGVRAR